MHVLVAARRPPHTTPAGRDTAAACELCCSVPAHLSPFRLVLCCAVLLPLPPFSATSAASAASAVSTSRFCSIPSWCFPVLVRLQFAQPCRTYMPVSLFPSQNISFQHTTNQLALRPTQLITTSEIFCWVRFLLHSYSLQWKICSCLEISPCLRPTFQKGTLL